MEKLTVAVVIVTYNGNVFIDKCLSSLSKSNIKFKVIVVDNNSDDDTVTLITKNFPEVEVMKLSENLGFGKANNIGIKHAYFLGAEHIFLLNQDAYVAEGAIEELVSLQRNNDEFVVISPLHLDGSGIKLDYKFSRHISQSSNIGQILSSALLHNQVLEFYEIDVANAAAWMLSRRAVEEVGLFNPVFDHYGEDFEYLHRTQRKGLKIGLSTKAHIYHDREQDSSVINFSSHKVLMHEKAWIIHRLCLKSDSNIFNIFSALKRALFANHPSIWLKVMIKVKLIIFIILNSKKIIRMRELGYVYNYAFLNQTPEFRR